MVVKIGSYFTCSIKKVPSKLPIKAVFDHINKYCKKLPPEFSEIRAINETVDSSSKGEAFSQDNILTDLLDDENGATVTMRLEWENCQRYWFTISVKGTTYEFLSWERKFMKLDELRKIVARKFGEAF